MNFHSMIDELVRVSNRYVLISLPSCIDLRMKYNILFKNRGGKYYGLPETKPLDRHKWIFHWEEANALFKKYTKKHNHYIAKEFINFNRSNTLKGGIINLLAIVFDVKSTAQSYWILIEKHHEQKK